MSQGRLIIGILVILFGLSFLFNFPVFKIGLALLVIWLGMRILTGKGSGMGFEDRTETTEDKLNRVLVFSGMNKKFISSNFKGGELVVVFAAADVDLTEVKTKEKQLTLELTAVFGGLKIVVPESWSVTSEGAGILGGYDNKTQLKGKKTVDLQIKGAAIFGGVEIVN